MTRKNEIVDLLYNHCVVENPSSFILKKGKFPKGWVDEYLKLLEEASQFWKQEEYWPQRLVASIHFTSFYYNARYHAWCKFNDDRNIGTENMLAKLRPHSELFLLNSFTQENVQDALDPGSSSG